MKALQNETKILAAIVSIYYLAVDRIQYPLSFTLYRYSFYLVTITMSWPWLGNSWSLIYVMTWASSNYDIECRWRTKYEPVVIKSILILILPVLLFFVYGIVSFVKAAVLSSACKDWSLLATTPILYQNIVDVMTCSVFIFVIKALVYKTFI